MPMSKPHSTSLQDTLKRRQQEEPFERYKTGLTRLLEQVEKKLAKDDLLYLEALTLQSRLEENIAQVQSSGDDENLRSARNRILKELNRLALDAVKVSFNDLCRSESLTPTGAIRNIWKFLLVAAIITTVSAVVMLLIRYREQPRGYIVFTSYREGSGDIYITDINQPVPPKQLTFHAGKDFAPACSPAGDQIAFTSDRTGKNQLYLMDLDGSNQRQVTFSAGNDIYATWSPDGQRLVYWSNRDGNEEIYTLDLSTGQETRLTYNPAIDINPAWSPKGDRIAFASESDGRFQIYLMDPDGSNMTRLTNLEKGAICPAWSPDGTKIAFTGGKSNPQGEIYLVDIRSPNRVTRLTVNAADEFGSAWSPDGQFIAFNSREKGLEQPYNGEIFVMKADGTARRQITFSDNTSFDPSWCIFKTTSWKGGLP
jgi:TolB protein